MSVIPLGDGVVSIPTIVKALKKSGFAGNTTLEISGVENIKSSVQRLQKWWNEL